MVVSPSLAAGWANAAPTCHYLDKTMFYLVPDLIPIMLPINGMTFFENFVNA
jgi:hypothetical protein